MQAAEMQWGEWLPASPDWKNPGCIEARNVIPIAGGYGPFRGLRPIGDTVTGASRGGATFYQIDSDPVVVGGTSTSLFSIISGTAVATTGLSDIGPGEYWDFAQFNDILVAVAPNNNPKYLDDIDTDTSWGDLTGSPPQARYVARVNNFLMLGNISTQPNRIQWSAVNNPTGAWAANRQTQAGFRDLPRALGEVRRIVGGRYGLVFQERGVLRLDYVGPPQVFRATEIETGRGAIAPFSVVTNGYVTYFLAQDGFYATDGSQFQRIGSSRVNSWFFENVAQDQIARTHAAVDLQNECVVWAFYSATAQAFDTALIYSWAQNRWSYAQINVGWLLGTRVAGVTTDGWDSEFSFTDDIPGTVDDAQWKAKEDTLAALVDGSTTLQLNYFDGAPLQADLESGQFQPAPGKRAFVSELRPIMETPDETGVTMAAVAANNTAGEVYGTFTVPNGVGFCPVRVDGRAIRVAQRIPAGLAWDKASGFQAAFRVSGAR